MALFLLTVAFSIWVQRARKVPALGPYGFFIFFSLLYNIVPWIAASFGVQIYSLSGEPELLDTQLVLAATANFAFAIVYLLGWDPASSDFVRDSRPMAYRIQPRLLFLAAYLPTLALVWRYGWHSFTTALQEGGSTGGGLFSIAAFAKLFLVAVYTHCLLEERLSRRNATLFLLLVVLLFVDGARTNFIMVLAITLPIYSSGRARVMTPRTLLLALGVGAVFILSRALFLDDAFAVSIANTLLAEGVLGSYMSLQTIHLLKDASFSLTFGLNYIVDPLLSLLPFSGGSPATLETWIASTALLLEEPFAPNGGFYFITEALIAFGWAGPAIVSAVYASTHVALHRRASRIPGLFLVYLGSFGCLFAKTQFGNCFKLFVVTGAFFVLIEWALRADGAAAMPPGEQAPCA